LRTVEPMALHRWFPVHSRPSAQLLLSIQPDRNLYITWTSVKHVFEVNNRKEKNENIVPSD
jgi:hypothetical protein